MVDEARGWVQVLHPLRRSVEVVPRTFKQAIHSAPVRNESPGDTLGLAGCQGRAGLHGMFARSQAIAEAHTICLRWSKRKV